MVKYTPPPPTLDHLNPVQRYMQKGQLDRQDWIRLGFLILIYFVLRPYIQKAAKWWFSDEKMVAGEKAQEEHMKKRAAKISANAIRSGKSEDQEGETVVEEIADGAQTSGSKVVGAGAGNGGNVVVNRKNKAQQTTTNGKKSTEDQLLDWDDEPARQPVDGGKTDVMQWLDKWDK